MLLAGQPAGCAFLSSDEIDDPKRERVLYSTPHTEWKWVKLLRSPIEGHRGYRSR